MRYDDTVTIATPEGVDLELTLAGAGSRFVSALVDLGIQAVLAIATVAAVGRIGGFGQAAVALVTTLVVLGYDIFFEVLASGRTPGKRLNGMRVVRSGGEPVGFLTSAIRNVLRLVDFLPFAYVIGATAILATRKNQRLGDLAAGTLVVRDRASKASPRSEAATAPAEICDVGHERDHRRGGRRRPPLPRAPTRDRGRRARRAGTHVRDAAVAEGCGRAGGTRRRGLPDAPRRCENGTRCGDALGSRAHSWWSRKGFS